MSETERRSMAETARSIALPDDARCYNCVAFEYKQFDDQDNITDGHCHWLPPPFLLSLMAALNTEHSLRIEYAELAMHAPEVFANHLCTAWKRKPR